MVEATREQIAADLEKIFRDTMGDWEYSGEIKAETPRCGWRSRVCG